MFENLPKIKVLSICSGVGGLDMPFMRDPDFEVIGFAEYDKHASAVLNYHYPGIRNYGDLTKIRFEELSDFNLLCGGTPCQSFSVAGKGKGFEGTSGLFLSFIEILKAKKPRYFIWENVKGSFSSTSGWDFARVQIEMAEAGYDVRWELLTAKEFGIPQNRERVFALGHLRGEGSRELLLESGEGRQNYQTEPNEQSGQESFIATRFLGRNGKLTSKDCPTIQSSDLPHIKENETETPFSLGDHQEQELLAWSSSGRSWGREERITKDHAHTLNTGDGGRTQSAANYIKEVKTVSLNRKEGIKKEIDTAHALSSSDWRGLNRNQNQNAVVEKVIEDAKEYMKKSRPNEEIEYSIKENGNIRPHRTDVKKSGISELNITYEDNVGNSITANHPPKIYRQDDIRIRKLTPLECERLMGWEDEHCKYGDYGGEIKEISNSQRYRMCGNGVVPQCVEPIKDLIKRHYYGRG